MSGLWFWPVYALVRVFRRAVGQHELEVRAAAIQAQADRVADVERQQRLRYGL